MIDTAVTFLCDQLNEYVTLKTGSSAEHVSMIHLADTQEDESALALGKIGCTLINVEEERVMKANRPISRIELGVTTYQNPEIRLNLYLLFSVDPRGSDTTQTNEKYKQALRLLSHVIRFFQGKHEFTPENSPAMDPALKLLRLELHSIPLEEQSYLWGAVSAAYLPSVVYRVRMLTILDDAIQGTAPLITEIEQTLNA